MFSCNLFKGTRATFCWEICEPDPAVVTPPGRGGGPMIFNENEKNAPHCSNEIGRPGSIASVTKVAWSPPINQIGRSGSIVSVTKVTCSPPINQMIGFGSLTKSTIPKVARSPGLMNQALAAKDSFQKGMMRQKICSFSTLAKLTPRAPQSGFMIGSRHFCSRESTRQDLDHFFKTTWRGRSLLFLLRIVSPILRFQKFVEDCAKDAKYQDVAKGLRLMGSALKVLIVCAILYAGNWLKNELKAQAEDLEAIYEELGVLFKEYKEENRKMSEENTAHRAEIDSKIEQIQHLYTNRVKNEPEVIANEKDDGLKCGDEDKSEAIQSSAPAGKSTQE